MGINTFGMRRSVGLGVVLSIVTCGIYSFYWLYQLLSAHYRLNNQPSNAGMDLVLSLVTCGIYFIYLMYKLGKLESDSYRAVGFTKDDSILYVILSIFSMSIVVYAIVQSNLNSLCDKIDGSGPGPFSPGQGPGYGNGSNMQF